MTYLRGSPSLYYIILYYTRTTPHEIYASLESHIRVKYTMRIDVIILYILPRHYYIRQYIKF